MKNLLILLTLFLCSDLISKANAAGNSATSAKHPKEIKWEFDGYFGRFDKQSIQRGYQIYQEVCASCHSLKRVAYRNLEEIGFSKDEVKKIASGFIVTDGPNDEGEMFERLALPSDKFIKPFPNEQAARAANGGAYPPDLSLIVKARLNGADYIYSLLTGYKEAPTGFELTEGKYYNPYFEGHQIAMPPPLGDDEIVEYQDGTFATQEQMSIDIVNFLQFAAEPEMEARKKMGIRTILFLAIMTILFIIAKRIVWSNLK